MQAVYVKFFSLLGQVKFWARILLTPDDEEEDVHMVASSADDAPRITSQIQAPRILL